MMAISSRIFRIFISSTFSDLQKERDSLQRKVFPKLKELCLQHGCRFQAIDLRWGVREEAALDQQTMKICLDEIKRCQKISPRPNFIVLLGNRYGWQPLPPEITSEEFDEIMQQIIDPDDKMVLNKWYKRDDNAVPLVYCLQPREVRIEKNASDKEKRNVRQKEAENWNNTEKNLRRILHSAIVDVQLTEEQRLKYEASATEQEIMAGAMKVVDAKEHVFCFFRKIKGLPHDESAKDYIDLDEKNNLDTEAQEKLDRLKKKLKKNLRRNIYDYEADWQGHGISTDHLNQFCDAVYKRLSKIIMEEIEGLEEIDPLDREVAEHRAFGRRRAKFFVGRERTLKNIDYYVGQLYVREMKEPHPFAVFGASGSGKSALIAHAAEQAQKQYSHATVITRFVGATPDSSDIRALLKSLCHQISRCYGKDESDIPSEYTKLVEEFPNRLAMATFEHPLVVFIDAIDQLSDIYQAQDLVWLPNILPQNVRLVVSTSSGESQSLLWKRLQYEDPRLEMDLRGTRFTELPPMQAEEGEHLLDLWLENSGRTLQPSQRKELLDKFDKSKLPLYLKMAFEEARCWKSYTEKVELSPDIQGIISDLFTRLTLDANHGEKMVSRTLGYLAASKNGLSEDELIDILSKDSEVFDDFKKRAQHEPPEQRLPVVVWSRLYFDMEPYISECIGDGISLIVFYHRQIIEAVKQIFLKGEELKRHRYIANYFFEQEFEVKADGKAIYNLRKLSELPYQQTHGHLYELLKETLTDFNFLYAKAMTVESESLINDYGLALQVYPESKCLRLLQDALKLSSHVLSYDVTQLAGQLSGRLGESDSLEVQKLLSQAQNWRASPWIRPLTPCLIRPGGSLLRTLTGHNGPVNGLAVTPDGRRIVSASDDKTLRVWDLESGRLMATLKGHSRQVRDVAITPDGRYVISASSDDTIKVWNLDFAEELTTLKGHTSAVNSIGFSFDGRELLTVSDDNTLRFWNLQAALARIYPYLKNGLEDESIELARATAYTGLKAIKVTPDEQRAIIVFDDRTISVWDLEKGDELHKLAGHMGEVYSIAVTPDGEKAISASEDGALKIWDLDSGRELRTIDCQSQGIHAVTVIPDGRRAVSGQHEGILKVWDLESGEELATMVGHSKSVEAIVVTPDRRRIVTGSSDNTIKIWDLEMKEKGVAMSCHAGAVRTVAVTHDGAQAVSISEDKTMKVWDLKTGKGLTTLRGFNKMVVGLASSLDSKHIISAFTDGSLSEWDLKTGKELSVIDGYTDSEDPVDVVAMVPDGKRVVSALPDGSLKVWDRGLGKELGILSGHTFRVTAAAITLDGQRVISVSSNGTVKCWNVKSGKKMAAFTGHKHAVECVSVTPDGKRVLSGDRSGILKVWDLKHKKELASIEAHNAAVKGVAMSPDGLRAVSCSDDTRIKMWDLKEMKLKATFSGDDALETCVLAPDEDIIVAGGKTGVVYILKFIE